MRYEEGLISVIMPCYNAASTIAGSIKCVLDQTYRDFELIIIDDGSTDASRAILEEAQKKDSRIKIIPQEHRGVLVGRNKGLGDARGEFIAFLDADDTWDKTFLEKLASALKTDPTAAIAYCGWQNIGFSGGGGKPYIPPDYDKTPDKLETFLSGNRWPIHAVLTRKSYIDKVGGFNEEILLAEDYYLWLQIAVFNKLVLVPEVLAFYYHYSDAQRSKRRVETETDVYKIKQIFIKNNPKLIKQLGKRKIKELTTGILFKRTCSFFWKGDLESAHKLFRKVFFTGFWRIKDLRYLVPSLLPKKMFINLAKMVRKDDK